MIKLECFIKKQLEKIFTPYEEQYARITKIQHKFIEEYNKYNDDLGDELKQIDFKVFDKNHRDLKCVLLSIEVIIMGKFPECKDTLTLFNFNYDLSDTYYSINYIYYYKLNFSISDSYSQE